MDLELERIVGPRIAQLQEVATMKCMDCHMAEQDGRENFCIYYEGEQLKAQQRNGSKWDDFTFPADQLKPADCTVDEDAETDLDDSSFGVNPT